MLYLTVQMMREQELSPGPGEIRDPPDPLKRRFWNVLFKDIRGFQPHSNFFIFSSEIYVIITWSTDKEVTTYIL